jgi:UTP:GlnB (protein PII) uridylyltransferase
MTWPHRGWALQRVLVADPGAGTRRAVERDVLRARLRVAARSAIEPAGSFAPSGEAQVDVEPCGGGRSLVRVMAPDRLGLLWAISSWLERHGCNILVARATPLGRVAVDVFLVAGEPDAADLAARLTGVVVSADS